MLAHSSGIQIPGSRNIFSQFGQVTPGQINQGVMPVGQVVGMPMYAGYPGITQVMPQPIPIPLPAVVPTPYTPVLRPRQQTSNIILAPGQPLLKPVMPGQKTNAPPPKPVPQTPPAVNRLASTVKPLAMIPLLNSKTGIAKGRATAVQGMSYSQIKNTSSARPGSSPLNPIAITRQGKAPIIPMVPKPDPIVSYHSPPKMPILTPQGPPPMYPPPKFTNLPPPLTLSPPSPKILRKTSKKKRNSIRVYDELVSQEEKRAMNPKYNAHLNKHITCLSESIEERLNSLQ